LEKTRENRERENTRNPRKNKGGVFKKWKKTEKKKWKRMKKKHCENGNNEVVFIYTW
jgi:23S rRNA G2445 N2-methylase RlmL